MAATRLRLVPTGTAAAADVVVLHWPEQADRAAELARSGTPRLLLVAHDADPPNAIDPTEEWIRLPADERDVAARTLRLTTRLGSLAPDKPDVDHSGRIMYRGEWWLCRRRRHGWP